MMHDLAGAPCRHAGDLSACAVMAGLTCAQWGLNTESNQSGQVRLLKPTIIHAHSHIAPTPHWGFQGFTSWLLLVFMAGKQINWPDAEGISLRSTTPINVALAFIGTWVATARFGVLQVMCPSGSVKKSSLRLEGSGAWYLLQWHPNVRQWPVKHNLFLS